jgi:hypothetical protein
MAFVFCAVSLAACAHRPEVKAMSLPSSAEVYQYVASQWTSVFSGRFARFVGLSTAGSQLVTVNNVDCGYYLSDGSISQCSFLVAARLANGNVVTRGMYDQFVRADDGALRETLVIIDRRK